MSTRPRKPVDISQRLLPFQQAITMPTHKAYCVYTHTYQGEVFYVGKGRNGRPFEVQARHPCWHEYVSNIPSYEISIVLWTDNEERALDEEARLISQLRPACNRQQSSGRAHSANGAGYIPQLLYISHELHTWLKATAESEFRTLKNHIIFLLEEAQRSRR